MTRFLHTHDGRLSSPRLQQLLVAALFAFLTILFIRSWPIGHPKDGKLGTVVPSLEPPMGESQGSATIFGHTLENVTKPVFQAARIRIIVSQNESMSKLPLLYTLDIDVPRSSEIHVENASINSGVLSDSTVSTTVGMPMIQNPPPDASAFLFGVATTYGRLENALDTMAHWLSSSNTSLIAAMQPTSDEELRDRVRDKATALNISLRTIDSGYEYLDRYFSLIRHFHANRTPETRWCVLIDDDTFFLDLRSLITTVDKKYDSSEPYYVGALTEDFQQMSNWGYMAYGGGGVFLSYALVAQLVPHWDDCYKKRNTGDRMLAECIYKHTTTKFTWEHGLHQLDLHGDQSGFYEALRRQPLSIHHWHSQLFDFHADVRGLSLVSSICGNDCLLQKFKLGEDWILTNGYSLIQNSHYKSSVHGADIDVSMERTWNYFYDKSSDVHFEHTLGPIRKVGRGVKVRFRMESAFADTDGTIRQLYVKRRQRKELNDGYDRGEVEGAVEVIWTKG